MKKLALISLTMIFSFFYSKSYAQEFVVYNLKSKTMIKIKEDIFDITNINTFRTNLNKLLNYKPYKNELKSVNYLIHSDGLNDRIEIPISDDPFNTSIEQGKSQEYSIYSASPGGQVAKYGIGIDGNGYEYFDITLENLLPIAVVPGVGTLYDVWFTISVNQNTPIKTYTFKLATVLLDASDNVIGGSVKDIVNITVTSPSGGPIADFTATPTSGTAPLTVQFTDQSTGNITNRLWDFGDGQTNTSTNPSHTYQNAGTYTVKLTVTGTGGSNTKTRANYINVSSPSTPVANFYGTPTSGTAPLTVQFTDQSTGNINSRSWDFGDDQNSTLKNPSHTYQNPGNYTVKLQVTGVGGIQSKIKSEYISVYSQPNLLVNGNFSDGEAPWMIYSHDPAAATGTIENGEYAIAITNGGQEEWHIQLSQTNVQVANSSSYQVSFDAYATSPRTIKAYIGMNADPWTAYSAYELFSLTTQKQTFTYTFTMNYPSDQEGRIVFDVGKSTSNIHFDNIILFQISDIGQATILIETFDVLPQLNHWGISDNSHITTSITNMAKEGTGALKMDWQVQAIESWGGSTGFWMWNSSNSNVWDLLGYEYLSLWYYIAQASSAPGHTYVQIEMWEVSHAPINTNNGDLTEKWNTYQKILDDAPGWKELRIPLVALETSSEYGFWLADWSQNKGNYQLDLNKIRGFYFGVNVDQALYQSNPDIARGIIIIDHLSAKKSSTEISNESKPIIRKEFSLLQNYPNPFNPATTISYFLTGRSRVKLSVYNLLGQEISVLEDGIKEMGSYSVKFDASQLRSGIYLYKLETNNMVYIKKMMLLR